MTNKPKRFNGLYYITHWDNLPSIFRDGIVSHNKAAEMEARGVKIHKIYNQGVVDRRKHKQTPDGKSLWDFANFYFQPRNKMLCVVYRSMTKKLAVLRLKNRILKLGKYISIGNAATDLAKIIDVKSGIAEIQKPQMQDKFDAVWWSEHASLVMSELLVPERVGYEHIDTIYVSHEKAIEEVRKRAPERIPIFPQPYMFLEPDRRRKLRGTCITLIDGDMFASKMDIHTISVNTVGVMGGGLAARARDNFPLLYKKFKECCRSGELTTNKPYLCEHKYSFVEHLADSPDMLEDTPDNVPLFLLFATKQHWRNPSKMEYLEGGLQWLVDNAVKSGITSLAMPALGCGLGGLRWEQAGPVMCRYLRKLNIPCEIYLPQEYGKRIPDAQWSEEFLLGENGKTND